MLITFQSPAFADVMLFGTVAKQLMEIIGKTPADRGIVTVEDLPAAIDKLKALVGANARPESRPIPDDGAEPAIGMVQRALPLLELFEWSLKRDVPVVWGV